MQSNDHLGRYRIVSLLGAGGMGEVWRAEDTTLGREVAVKLLPPALAADPERLARFEREARVLAGLNHPGIATLHGLETTEPDADTPGPGDRVTFLVMELVEGEGLDERLARGPIPVAEAVPAALQIADALAAAHAAGIVHRDLKPANVRLRPDGAVKVLDFGLAKAWEADTPDADLSLSPTMTKNATAAGVVLGTAAYMSPEQARGTPVDRRADVWAFGVVLWEMLTGRRLFDGDTVSDVLADVLRGDIDLDAVPPDTPRQVRRLLRRCLERDPKRRLHDIADARLELQDAAASPEPATHPAQAAAHTPWSRAVLAVLAVALLGSLAANLSQLRRTRPPAGDDRRLHLSIPLPDGARLVAPSAQPLGLGLPAVAISDDGTTVACAVEADGVSRLFVRRLDEPVGALLPDTEGAHNPTFSPDGRWIAFGSGSLIRRIRTDGSGAGTIREAPNVRGIAWLSNTELLVAAAEGGTLLRVSAETGDARAVTTDGNPRSYSHAEPVPGREHVVYSAPRGRNMNPDSSFLMVRSLSAGGSRELIAGGVSPRALASGHLAFVRAAELLVAPFDLDRLEILGEPQPVIAGVLTEARGVAQYDIADDGTLVFAPGGSLAVTQLVWVDRAGVAEPLPFEPQVFGDFQLSPDRTRLAVTVALNRNHIWVYDLERGTTRRLSDDDGGQFPIWSPDGRRIAYFVASGDTTRSVWREVDGAGEPHELAGSAAMVPYAWTDDGTLFLSRTPSGIWAAGAEGSAEPRVVVDEPGVITWGPAVSPDGRWVAYTSDASGRYEVVVRPLTGAGRTWTISTNGGEEPVWSSDGSELFYRSGDRWYAVPVDIDGDLRPGTPEVVVTGPYINVPGRSFDVSADGDRLLLLRPIATVERPDRLDVVRGWLRPGDLRAD